MCRRTLRYLSSFTEKIRGGEEVLFVPDTKESGLAFQESPFIELVECLAQFFLCIHHDGTPPGNRLPQRTSRDEEETDAVIAGPYHDFIPIVEYHQRAIVGDRAGCIFLLSSAVLITEADY